LEAADVDAGEDHARVSGVHAGDQRQTSPKFP
jgi:hypothetical protein